MIYLKDFRERIQNNDYPGFLKIWEEYCYGDDPDGEEIIAVLESIKASELAKSFGNHVDRILSLWKLLKDPELAHDCLRLIFDLQTTQNEDLADLATEYLKNRYPEDPMLLEKFRIIGLRNREKFTSAIRNFELLTHMKKGNYVFHNAGWGTAEIVDVSAVREEVSLDCEHTAGIQHLSFEKAFRTLIPIQMNHFYARRFGDADNLEKEARENPAEVIRMLLTDLGPKTASEIKEELQGLVIPEEDWNRWWQTARGKIKKDTLIESPKDLKQPFSLRDKELPHEVAFHKALETQPSIEATLQAIYAFLRDFPETLKNGEFKASLETRLMGILEHPHLPDEHALQTLLLLEDLGHTSAEKQLTEYVEKSGTLTQIIAKIQIVPFQKRLLQLMKSLKPHWSDLYLELLLNIEQNLVRDFLLAELDQTATKEMLKRRLNTLLIHPLASPEIFFWYFQKIITPKSKLPFSDPEGQKRFFEQLMILLDNIEQKPAQRDLSKKIIQLLTADRYKLVRDIFQHTHLNEIKEYLLLATKCESLSDHDIKIFHSLAEVVHPSLSHLKKDKDDEKDDEQIIWTTKEGYQKIQQRMQQIATVETVHNAKEIETARGHGDLRENAEFKAALERRDRLQSELKLLSEQVNRAQILTAADISTEKVGIGSVVDCRDSKGQHLRFTLLGPWDADPEKRILSFQSKLAQAMKGKVRGETFEFQGEKFSIEEIENFFDLQQI